MHYTRSCDEGLHGRTRPVNVRHWTNLKLRVGCFKALDNQETTQTLSVPHKEKSSHVNRKGLSFSPRGHHGKQVRHAVSSHQPPMLSPPPRCTDRRYMKFTIIIANIITVIMPMTIIIFKFFHQNFLFNFPADCSNWEAPC